MTQIRPTISSVAAAVSPAARAALEVGMLLVERTIAHRALRIDPEPGTPIRPWYRVVRARRHVPSVTSPNRAAKDPNSSNIGAWWCNVEPLDRSAHEASYKALEADHATSFDEHGYSSGG